MAIIKSPTLTLDFGTGAEDFSDHVIAADPDMAHSVVDDRTFGLPHASDSVSANHAVTLSMRWSDTLAGLFDGHEDTDTDMVLTSVTGGGTWEGTVRFSAVPAPSIKIGEQAECELVLAVVDELTWTA